MRKTKNNYYEILKFQTAEEINKFLSMLDEEEKHDLFAYTYGYVIPERYKRGTPVTEYFLLHYDEFIPYVNNEEIGRANKTLSVILDIAVAIIIVIIIK